MRLGIISDTHGLLRPEVFEAFKEVDLILHAGDIGPLELLTELEAIAPVHGGLRQYRRLGCESEAAQGGGAGTRGDLGSWSTHGNQFGSPTPEALNAAFPEADVLIFGHTHRPLLTTVDITVTAMNPGGAGVRRFDLPPSVGIMELEAGLPPRARLVPLLAAGDA